MINERPELFFLEGCPFCLKVRLYILEAGLQDQVNVVLFERGSELEAKVRETLAPHLEKVSYPAARFADGYITESDVILQRLRDAFGVAPGPVYTTYAGGVFPRMMAAFRENAELKRGAA